MLEFFRGWRRRVGCISLLVACLFMAGWVRSQSQIDDIKIPSYGSVIYGVTSMGGGLDFHKLTAIGEPQWSRMRFQSTARKSVELEDTPWFNHEMEWRWDWAGFHFGVGHVPNRRDEDYMIPYWSITLSMTLIALWLLLKKPRNSTLKKIVEPTADEGGA